MLLAGEMRVAAPFQTQQAPRVPVDGVDLAGGIACTSCISCRVVHSHLVARVACLFSLFLAPLDVAQVLSRLLMASGVDLRAKEAVLLAVTHPEEGSFARGRAHGVHGPRPFLDWLQREF